MTSQKPHRKRQYPNIIVWRWWYFRTTNNKQVKKPNLTHADRCVDEHAAPYTTCTSNTWHLATQQCQLLDSSLASLINAMMNHWSMINFDEIVACERVNEPAPSSIMPNKVVRLLWNCLPTVKSQVSTVSFQHEISILLFACEVKNMRFSMLESYFGKFSLEVSQLKHLVIHPWSRRHSCYHRIPSCRRRLQCTWL